MIQMDRVCSVSEQFECLIMMSVHVSHQEVKDGEVNDIQEPPPLVIRTDVLDNITILGIRLPGRFPSLVVTPSPRMSPGLPLGHSFTRQKGRKASFQ